MAGKDANVKKHSTRSVNKYYSVSCGNRTGIFLDWKHCSESIKYFPGAKHHGCRTLPLATEFLNHNHIPHSDILVHISDGGALQSVNLSDYCEKIGAAIPDVTPPLTHVHHDPDEIATVWVDGACQDNGQNDAAGGYGIYWGENNPLNTSEPLPDDGYTPTNNRAEMYASIRALQQATSQDILKLIVKTDSTYVIQGITSLLHKWKADNSLQKRPNKDLWAILDSLNSSMQVQWSHVKGHTGDPGNEAADRLANEGILKSISNENDNMGSSTNPPRVHINVCTPDREGSDKVDTPAVDPTANDLCPICVEPNNKTKTKLEAHTQTPQTVSHVNTDPDPVAGELGIGSDKAGMSSSENGRDKHCNNDSAPTIVSNSAATIASDSAATIVSDLKALVNTISSDLAEYKTAFQNVQGSIVDKFMLERKANTDLKLELLVQTNATSQKDITRLTSQLKQKTLDYDKLCTESEKLSESLAELHNKRAGTKADEPDISLLQTDLANLKQENASLTKVNSDLSAETKTLCEQIKTCKLDLTIKTKEQEASHKYSLELERRLDNMKLHLDKTIADNAEAQTKIGNLSDEVLSWKLHQQQGSGPMTEVTKDRTKIRHVPSSPQIPANEGAITSNAFAPLEPGATSQVAPLESGATSQVEPTPINLNNLDIVPSNLTESVPLGEHSRIGDGQKQPKTLRPVNIEPDVDVLIVGNSHTSPIVPRRMYPGRTCSVKTLAQKNISGAYQYILDCARTPKFIIFHVVDNDLGDNTVDYCLQQLKDLLKLCGEKYPQTRILISEALPRLNENCNITRQYNLRCKSLNDKLSELDCKIIKHENLHQTEANVYRDGTHLNQLGTAYFIRNLKFHTYNLLGLPNYEYYKTTVQNEPPRQDGPVQAPLKYQPRNPGGRTRHNQQAPIWEQGRQNHSRPTQTTNNQPRYNNPEHGTGNQAKPGGRTRHNQQAPIWEQGRQNHSRPTQTTNNQPRYNNPEHGTGNQAKPGDTRRQPQANVPRWGNTDNHKEEIRRDTQPQEPRPHPRERHGYNSEYYEYDSPDWSCQSRSENHGYGAELEQYYPTNQSRSADFIMDLKDFIRQYS